MKQWLLIVFDVPDELGGLLSRLYFKRTSKNPSHWFRIFTPSDADHADALVARGHLLAAGLKGRWKQIETKSPPPRHHPTNGFGGGLNATPIASSWRRRHRYK